MHYINVFTAVGIFSFTLINPAAEVASQELSVIQPQNYIVSGGSAAHRGFYDGALITLAKDVPKKGTMAVFECSHALCEGLYIKELKYVKNGCYWLEGREGVWHDESGLAKYSVDSRTSFGWLCGDEITFHGTAVNTL